MTIETVTASGKVPSEGSVFIYYHCVGIGLTSRDGIVLVSTSIICVLGEGGSSGQGGGHVEKTKEEIESSSINFGVGLVDNIECSEDALVADDVWVDGLDEFECGVVVSRNDIGDEWDGNVGTEVGRELGEDRSHTEESIGGVVGHSVDGDCWCAQESTIRFLSVWLGADISDPSSDIVWETYVLVHRTSRTRGYCWKAVKTTLSLNPSLERSEEHPSVTR